MKIVSVVAHLVRIPLATPYVISRGTLDAFTNVVTEIRTDDGLIGHGEAVPVSLIGDPVQFKAVIENDLAPIVMGRDPSEIESLVDACLRASRGVVASVAGIDLALWDLVGQALGTPVSALLGTARRWRARRVAGACRYVFARSRGCAGRLHDERRPPRGNGAGGTRDQRGRLPWHRREGGLQIDRCRCRTRAGGT